MTNDNNIAGQSSGEWGSSGSNQNLGQLIELKGDKVAIIGTIEAGKNIEGLPNYWITIYDQKSGKQTDQQILMDGFFKYVGGNTVGTGVKVDDKVEIQGYRTDRGYIKAVALLNLETWVRTGKITQRRHWILVLSAFFLLIGFVGMKTSAGITMIALLVGIVGILVFLSAKKKTKFLSENVKNAT